MQLKNWITGNFDLSSTAPTEIGGILNKTDRKRPLPGSVYSVYNILHKSESNEGMQENIHNKWNKDLSMEDVKNIGKECLQLT